MELERHCPVCDEERTYWLTASTELHLGEKTKYRCAECDHGFVRIDGDVDTSVEA